MLMAEQVCRKVNGGVGWLLGEEGDGEVEDGVVAGEGGLGVEVDGAAFGGVDTEFGGHALGVKHRCR